MSDTHDPPKTDDHSVPPPPVPAQAPTTPLPTSPKPTTGPESSDATVLAQSYDQQHAVDAAEADHRGEEHMEESHHDVMSDALLDDMVDFDAAFDPDTLANLAALSRIQGMVDEAVAEDDRQEQHVEESEAAQGDSGEMVDFSMFLPGMAEETDQSASILQGLDQGQPVEVEESHLEETGGQGGTPNPEPEVEQQPEAATQTTTEPEALADAATTAPVDSTIVLDQPVPTPPAPKAVGDEATPPTVDSAPDTQPTQPENLPSSPAKSAPIVVPQAESTAEEAQVPPSSAEAPASPGAQDAVGPQDSQDQLPIDPALLPASGQISRAASTVPDSDAFSERISTHHKGDRDGDEAGRDDEGDDDFGDSKYVYEDGKLKRRRQRTVLSCTECHRRCDRNIPCSRCVKRGVASMCRMEMPPVQERKRRKMTRETPVNYELGVRVQALESLIRSGSTLDPDSASSAAMETILHATRAAELGSSDATSALAQLTDAMGGQGIGSMSQDAQSTLLMDVLQQLSVASLTKPPEEVQEKSRPSGKQDMWSNIALPRPDPMTRIANAYEEDVAPTKINLSLPGFREDEGKIFVPPTVRYVEKQMRNESMLAAEALPVWGDDKFLEAGIKFAYGTDEKRYRRDHVSAVQAISLTGALRLAGTFLSRIPSRGRQVYLPSPSTDEETRTLRDAGLEIRYYRFLDRKTGNVDFDGLREDILTAPERSAILLFVTGSMPTGLDLSLTQWKSLITLLHQRNLIPLVVMAFQGLVTGDPSQDAEPLRLMAHEGLPVVLCQIFDATMGLYADSPSIVSIVTQSEESKERVDGQLRGVARGLYLHPSPWGAFVARAILSDSKLHPAWLVEIKAMSDRLRSVREKLYDLLATKFKTPGTWSHIKKSVGMYCTTLLPPAVNDSLTLKRHIHLLPHGSISLGTLNSPKIEALARAIDSVVLAYNRELEEAQAQQLAMQIALAAAREAAAREEEEAEAQAAEDEDRMLLEQDLASAIEAQTRAEEDERRREEEEKGLEEAVRRAAERAETARAAEAILASITAGHAF